MDQKGHYPIIIYEEINNFFKTYNAYEKDKKKSFEIKIDNLFENLKFKTNSLEKKEIEVSGRELLEYSLSEIDCKPSEFNTKNIAIKLKSKMQSENISQIKTLWDFLFCIDDTFNVNNQFVFSERSKNRTPNEYDLISFRDDVIYYFCINIRNKKEETNDFLSLLVYAFLRIQKNQYSKCLFILILSICIAKGNLEFKFFVEMLLKGVNEKNEQYLLNVINETLKENGAENKKIEKINYSMKGIKALKKMFIDLVETKIKNQ